MTELPFAKKSLGQHWLTDENTLADIAKAAGIRAGECVLEIGPGAGTLTLVLLAAGAEVIAVEFDNKLFEQLQKDFQTKRNPAFQHLTLVNQDILKFDLTTLPHNYKVVANIPYYLTSNLLRILSETSNPPSRCVLLMQKEVAERVVAQPGGMSLLAVTAQYYWQARLGLVVPARLFTPPPKVDSQVLILERRTQPVVSAEAKPFFRLVKMGFAARRKTLNNSLSVGLKIGKAETADLLTRAGVNPLARPQDLSLMDWQKVYDQAAALF